MNKPAGRSRTTSVKTNTPPVLRIRGLEKTYAMPGKDRGVTVFKGLDLLIDKPRIVAIMGESGSGKTTLLNLIGFLDTPTSGTLEYLGQDRKEITDPALFRREKIGFVFQSHLLQEEFSAVENTALPLLLRGIPMREALERASKVLEEVGLKHRLHHKPGEMSGGENQRAAIARALVHSPAIVLADEPTGNLDFENQEMVNELFIKVNERRGMTVIVATHSEELARRCHEVWHFRKGRLVRPGRPGKT
jgi:lipoprotein-releasing system ATP-binding protein